MKVLVIEPHKKPYTKEVEHTLENLQGIVGGLIEPIYLDDVAIVVNEEGKINGLPFNRALRDENRKILDLLFGTFFICGLGEENFTDIPEQAIPKYSKMFSCHEYLIKTERGIGVFTI